MNPLSGTALIKKDYLMFSSSPKHIPWPFPIKNFPLTLHTSYMCLTSFVLLAGKKYAHKNYLDLSPHFLFSLSTLVGESSPSWAFFHYLRRGFVGIFESFSTVFKFFIMAKWCKYLYFFYKPFNLWRYKLNSLYMLNYLLISLCMLLGLTRQLQFLIFNRCYASYFTFCIIFVFTIHFWSGSIFLLCLCAGSIQSTNRGWSFVSQVSV